MDLGISSFRDLAVCKARINENNSFEVGQDNRDGTDLDLGDEVAVRIINLDSDKIIKQRDSTRYSTTIQQTGQIHIPNRVMSELSLSPGNIIGYMVVASRNVPGVNDGPVRDRIRDEPSVEERTRETNRMTFSGPMASTGQVTVPKNVREQMNLRQGDAITVTVDGQKTKTVNIGTGNRIVIPTDVRGELGLEKGDEPSVQVTVF